MFGGGGVPQIAPKIAQVAELVDALASGASDRKIVEVRVFSWAPSYFCFGERRNPARSIYISSMLRLLLHI